MSKVAKIIDGTAKASVIFFAIVLALIYLADWAVSLTSPYSIMYEGPMLMLGEMIAQGKNIYATQYLTIEPWMVCIYPPFYLLCAGALLKFFGINYISLRVFSMLCCAASVYLAFRIFRLSGCSKIVSLTATTFLFSFNAIYGWTYVARPDMLVTFLSLFLVERFVAQPRLVKSDLELNPATDSTQRETPPSTPSVPELIASLAPIILLSWLALFAKQQAAVFVVAIAIFLLTIKRGRASILYITATLISAAISILIAQMITGGFLAHLSFLSGVKTTSLALIQNIASLGLDWFKVLFALIALPLSLLLIRNQPQLQRLPLLLFLISATVAYFSMSIPGSNVNHMFPALFAMSWLLAFMLTRSPSWLIPIVVLCSAPSLLQIAETFRYGPQLLPFANKSAAELKSFKFEGQPVLTDDPGINYMTHSVPVFEDCVTFLNVWANKPGGFDQLNSNIEKQKYAAVIINSADVSGEGGPGWWPKSTIDSLKKAYKKHGELNCSGWALDLWVPIPSAER